MNDTLHPAPAATPPRNRRAMRIVDHGLQQSMLVALVLMEVAIVTLAIWTLYQALAAIVDENLYRIHFHGGVDMLSLLVREGTPILGAMLVTNLVALMAADRIWICYVRGIAARLTQMMAAAARLDFAGEHDSRFHHAVLDQARAWRALERARLGDLRRRIGALPAALPAAGPQRVALEAALAQLAHG